MYLVFDIGGTFVKYAMISSTGKIQFKNKIPTLLDQGIEPFIHSLALVYQEMKGEYAIDGIAVSTPGAVDVEKGIVYNGGNLPFLHQQCLRDLVSEQCDGIKVAVENDGKCAGLAEAWIGSAKDVQDAIVIAFGTGIAGAVIKDKKIHRGNRLIAGEVSFLLNDMDRHHKPTIWAHQNSALSLGQRLAAAKNDSEAYSGEKFFAMLEQGDADADNILKDFAYSASIHLYNLQLIFDPDVICIGGGISEQPRLIEEIKNQVNVIWDQVPHIGKPNIVKCKFNNDSNLLGALYNYMQVYELV